MVEDYRIIIRTGSAEPTGQYEVNRKGNRKPVLKYTERYETRAGTFQPEEWKTKALEAIKENGELELLEKVKEYCRNHCAWLRREKNWKNTPLIVYAEEYTGIGQILSMRKQ